jgi:hypothetical protein
MGARSRGTLGEWPSSDILMGRMNDHITGNIKKYRRSGTRWVSCGLRLDKLS